MSSSYRPEIEGLRAFAVFAVIGYHFFPSFIPSGYLGVDIFFVISGYVITGSLSNSNKHYKSKLLIDFYLRRIKRIAPALILCVTVTGALFAILTTNPLREIFILGASSLLGLSNFGLLYKSRDYFAIDTQLNPFTQTWSLSVEEQFYLIYPAIYLWFSKRFLIILTFISAITFVFLYYYYAPLAFYLMPARFWELSIGALTFYLLKEYKIFQNKFVSISSAIVLFFIIFFSSTNILPLFVIICVISSSLMIASMAYGDPIYTLLTNPFSMFFGRISYSLYLWHWSILVLGKYTLGLTTVAAFVLLFITLIISICSYFFIEKPIRSIEKEQNIRIVSLILTMASLSIIFLIFIPPHLIQTQNNNLPNLLGITAPESFPVVPCHHDVLNKFIDSDFSTCLGPQRTNEKAKIIYLLGDSHAAQLFPMLKAETANLPYMIQYMNPADISGIPINFGAGTKGYKIATYILDNMKLGDIIIITFHRGFFNDQRDKHVPLNEKSSDNDKVELYVNDMKPFIKKWSDKGAKIIFVNDTPLMNSISTSAACMFQIKTFGSSICKVSKIQDLHTRERQDSAFKKLSALSPNVYVWDPLPLVYEGKSDLEVIDDQGKYIMWDWNHITLYQSLKLGTEFRKLLQ